MDLRTIMNCDSAGVSNKPPQAQPPPPSPLQQTGRASSPRRTSYPNEAPPVGHPPLHSETRARPPPPPPLQPPLHSPARSSSYGSAQSPYHSSASSILSGVPHPHNAQSLSHGPQTFLPVARDSFQAPSAAIPHQSSSLCSPFTPQPLSSGTQHSYFSQTRSHSIQSATTPSSVRSFSFPAHREEIAIPQPPPPEPHRTLSFSPNQPSSQPVTPLGPPHGTFRRVSPHATRPPSSGQDGGEHSANVWDRSDMRKGSREAASPVFPAQTIRQPSLVDQRHKQHLMDLHNEMQRTSVSPKSMANRASQVPGDPSRGPDRLSQVQSKIEPDSLSWQTNNTGTNVPPAQDNDTPSQSLYPPTTPKTSLPSQPSTSSHPSSMSPTMKQPPKRELETSSQGQVTSRRSSEHRPSSSAASTFVPRKKPKRYHEPPIFAQQAPRASGAPPAIPVGYKPPPPPVTAKSPFQRRETPGDRPTSQQRLVSLQSSPARDVTSARSDGGAGGNNTQAASAENSGSLGQWEPTITGVIPYEEITKTICDFLFQHVVLKRDIGAGPAGATATGPGAILEVEAKLGQLIDQNTRERIRFPIHTESVINKDDPSLRGVIFKSSMTLDQHRVLNNFLNESVKSSMAPNSGRIPLTYAHKKERDTFYEIGTSSLPPIVQHHLNPRHKPKVRVTTNQRTGQVTTRIIKCRIADMDIYSPRTHLDWRISVNLEMNYDGDVNELAQAPAGGFAPRERKPRIKDRMSYRHLAYQIDLTQVSSADSKSSSNPDFEHELEVEVSSAEIRRQGDLALAGDPSNQYQELIKGFVDNVRVLARAAVQA